MTFKKVTVNLPTDQVEFLQKIASDEGLSVTDALRRAINTEKFFVQHERAGHKILVEGSGQRIREVVRS